MMAFFEFLIESAIACLWVWLVYKLFLAKLTFFAWNRLFLLLGLITALLLPLFSFDLSINNSLSIQELSLPVTNSTINLEMIAASTPATNFWLLATILYLSVSLLFLFRLGFSVYSIYKNIKKASFVYFENQVCAVHETFSPSSFFRFVLLSPHQLGMDGIEQIIKHESAHVGKGHSWDLMFMQFLKSVFWLNPILHLIENALKEVHEFEADAEVIQEYPAIPYSRLLLKSIAHSTDRLTPSFNQFQTKKRIIMMNKPKSNSREKSKFLIGVPLVATLILLFSCQITGIQDTIKGNWIGSDFQFEQSKGPDLSAMIEAGKNLHINGKLQLNENKTYQIADPAGTVNGKGVWKVENKLLVLTDENKNVQEYKVVELKDDILITEHLVAMDTPGGEVAGTITLTYKRE